MNLRNTKIEENKMEFYRKTDWTKLKNDFDSEQLEMKNKRKKNEIDKALKMEHDEQKANNVTKVQSFDEFDVKIYIRKTIKKIEMNWTLEEIEKIEEDWTKKMDVTKSTYAFNYNNIFNYLKTIYFDRYCAVFPENQLPYFINAMIYKYLAKFKIETFGLELHEPYTIAFNQIKYRVREDMASLNYVRQRKEKHGEKMAPTTEPYKIETEEAEIEEREIEEDEIEQGEIEEGEIEQGEIEGGEIEQREMKEEKIENKQTMESDEITPNVVTYEVWSSHVENETIIPDSNKAMIINLMSKLENCIRTKLLYFDVEIQKILRTFKSSVMSNLFQNTTAKRKLLSRYYIELIKKTKALNKKNDAIWSTNFAKLTQELERLAKEDYNRYVKNVTNAPSQSNDMSTAYINPYPI